MTDDGENFTVLGMFGVTVNVLLTVVPFAAAEIFTVVLVVTTFVVTAKFAVELPAGTVTEAGMDATAEPPLVTVNVTSVSMAAGAAMVTVPTVDKPPTTELGANLRVLGISGVTVRTVVRFVSP